MIVLSSLDLRVQNEPTICKIKERNWVVGVQTWFLHVLVLDDGQDGCGEGEGDDPGDEAGEAGFGLGQADLAGLEGPADGVVALSRDGQDGQNTLVGHSQLNEGDSVAHELKNK